MPTIREVIATIERTIGGTRPETVDTLKAGNADNEITKIVCSFQSTVAVIEETIRRGANFLVTHEPTYYEHVDVADWHDRDPVVAKKRKLIEEAGLTIWRFHDGWHDYVPDGITLGFLRAMGWEDGWNPEEKRFCPIPATTLGQILADCKTKLSLDVARYVGDPAAQCTGVGLALGSPGTGMMLDLFREERVDVLFCGETSEWQVCEYVRDANALGIPKAIVVLGHEKSEEDGMAYFADWLGTLIPGLTIEHVPSGDPYAYA